MAFEVLEARLLGDSAVVIHGINEETWQGNSFGTEEWVTEMFVRSPEGCPVRGFGSYP